MYVRHQNKIVNFLCAAKTVGRPAPSPPVEPPLEQPPDERTQLGATWLIEQSTRRLRQRPRGQAEAAVDVLADAAELLGGALHVVHLEAGSKQRSKQGQSNGQSGVKAGSKQGQNSVKARVKAGQSLPGRRNR